MSPRLRAFLFYICFFLFIVAGAYLFLILQGFTFDWHSMTFQRTGGIFVRFHPRDATLTVHQKTYHNSWNPISSGILIRNLPPGSYSISVSRPNFFSWVKHLTVQSGLVTPASSVRLWPTAPFSSSSLYSNHIKDFWLTSRGPVLLTEDANIVFKDYTLKGNQVVFTHPDFDIVVTSFHNTFYITDLDEPRAAINAQDLFASLLKQQLPHLSPQTIESFSYSVAFPSQLLLLTSSHVFSLHLPSMNLSYIFAGDKLSHIASTQKEIFLIQATSTLVTLRPSLRSTSITPLDIAPISGMFPSSHTNTILFLTRARTLIAYDRTTGSFSPLMDNVRLVSLSPAGNRVLFTSSSSQTLYIYYLDEYDTDFKRTQGSLDAISSTLSSTPQSISWIPSVLNYAFFLHNSSLSVGDLDPRPPMNTYYLLSGVTKFDFTHTTLYTLSAEGNFTAYEFNLE